MKPLYLLILLLGVMFAYFAFSFMRAFAWWLIFHWLELGMVLAAVSVVWVWTVVNRRKM